MLRQWAGIVPPLLLLVLIVVLLTRHQMLLVLLRVPVLMLLRVAVRGLKLGLTHAGDLAQQEPATPAVGESPAAAAEMLAAVIAALASQVPRTQRMPSNNVAPQPAAAG